MNYIAAIFGVWILVCWHLITRTIRENPELHLVYKRPKWVQAVLDKSDYEEKLRRAKHLKSLIWSLPYQQNKVEINGYIREFVKLSKELKKYEANHNVTK